MKYKHFLIVSICISIVYVIGLYIINRKYNIVEKLGNFSGNYNSTANFTVHPKFVSTDTSTTFDGPLKIKTKTLPTSEIFIKIIIYCWKYLLIWSCTKIINIFITLNTFIL